MARRLAVRLYWMWRNGWEYTRSAKFCSRATRQIHGRPLVTHGAGTAREARRRFAGRRYLNIEPELSNW
jgi:hypothetical protein